MAANWKKHDLASLTASLVLMLPATVLGQAPGVAPETNEPGWFTFTEENNNLGSDRDRYYVNGFAASWLSPVLKSGPASPCAVVCAVYSALPLLFPDSDSSVRKMEWTVLGQQIFTPADKTASVPDPADRPYAAWLYTGIDLLQDQASRGLDDLSMAVGIVGPAALGRPVQNGVHKIFGFGSANGWSHQLSDEPGLLLGYAHKWRFARSLSGSGVNALQVDAIPELGFSLGNVMTQIESTMLVRIGWGLGSSYGPRLLQPGMEGDGFLSEPQSSKGSGFYVFAGGQARGVAHDIFLDGNTYADGPSVSRYPWAHSWLGGMSALLNNHVRLDLSYVRMSREFPAQQGPESYGSITASFQW